MIRHTYQTTTSVSADKLYRTISDINRWPEWGDDLDEARIKGPSVKGAKFILQPKGDPKVNMMVEESLAPTRFADIAKLPLARMRTIHAFTAKPEGTHIAITIEIFGPLAFLWDRIIARKIMADIKPHTEAFIAFANSVTDTGGSNDRA